MDGGGKIGGGRIGYFNGGLVWDGLVLGGVLVVVNLRGVRVVGVYCCYVGVVGVCDEVVVVGEGGCFL